jgi:hypothetical protein
MSKSISRKNFIRNFGMATLGLPGLVAFTNTEAREKNGPGKRRGRGTRKKQSWDTRRGSWVSKGEAADGDLILAAAGKGCHIVLNAKEGSAVRQAVKFFSDDIRKISGYYPKSGTDIDKAAVNVHIVTLGNAPVPADIPVEDLRGKWEAFKIITTGGNLWLVGSDARGTAFALYTLSERLGIDPLYIWTGFEPEKNSTLILKKTDYTGGSPTFKYRGFFHDDEDILPRPFEWSGYPLRVGDIDILWYQRYFETALRLRMNMVAPYTRVHRRYEVQKCASDWGLIYTSHHYDVLLSNPFGIERFNLAEKRDVNPEWNWFKNREGMVKYWRGGVWENKELNCIWPVGLRGTNDYGYPFPKGMSEARQTEVFNNVIQTQVDTVKNLLPCNEDPVFAFTLYTEMLNKYEADKSAFNLPDDIIIVWPDDNNGVMRGLPKHLGKWKHGVYYHLAYYGMDLHKQGTHIVSPDTITSQFKNIIASGATGYMLVNVSELRDYVMEARLIAEICWDGPSMLSMDDPADHYIRWFCNEYFGPHDTEDTAEVYRRYYKLLYEPKKLWFGADLVWTLLDHLVKKFKGESYKPAAAADVALLKERNTEYEAVMELIAKCEGNMTDTQAQYFFENTRLGLSFDWRPTQAALLLHQALGEEDREKAWELIDEAIKPLEQLELDILRAERPPFDKWYRESWIRGKLSSLNVHRSYDLVRAFIASGGTEAAPPKRNGHDNLEQSKIWTNFLEASERLNDPLSRS